MARAASATDFTVDVENIGRFVFARRTAGDVYKIRGRYNVMTEGNYDDQGNVADLSALGFVSIQTLLVSAPESFDIDKLDPLMDDDFDKKVMKVFGALRTREQSFRPKPKAGSDAAGAGAGEQSRALVPGEVQPPADRPTIPVDDAGRDRS